MSVSLTCILGGCSMSADEPFLIHLETSHRMEMTSDNRHVVASDGQIITFQVSQRKNTSDPSEKNILVFSRKVFNADAGHFIETCGGEYSVPSSKSALQLVCARCVADVRTGVRLPCVLLRTCKRKSSGSSRLILLLLHPSNVLEPHLKFKVDAETMEDLHITDGPTVLWRQHEKLLYLSSLTSEILTAPIDVSAVLWAGAIEDGACILGITSMRLDGERLAHSSLPNRTLQGKEFILFCIENQKVVPASCLLPHPYASVLRCLEVCAMQNLNGRYETSVIAASGKQLISFHNGVPKQVCQLPTENPSKLQVAYTGQADVLCVLSFPSGDACGIWKDGWKMAATWQGVRNVLVDDFVGTGSDQVLLLFNDDDPSDSSEPRPFRLTDCGNINYPADPMDDDTSGFQENHFLMLQTLEARLQANLLSLEELQRHTQVQDRVLESSCRALIDMSLGMETSVRSAETEGLVPLWDDGEDYPYPLTTDTSPPGDCSQLVDTIWHRIVDDVLVVGVKLKSSAPETLSDIGLSLIMDREGASTSPVAKCQTNVLKLAISSSQDSSAVFPAEPSAKKQRFDKGNLLGNSQQSPCPSSYQNDLERTVTAVTALSSVLALNNAACALLLHARRKTQPDCLLRSEKLIVPCGSVSLSLEDVLKGKHTVNVFEHCQGSWSLEDIFAVLSAFGKCSLHILSDDYTLTSVTEWMRNHMNGESLKLIPDIVMCNKDGSLHGTLLTWSPKTPCEGNLTVYYRNDSVLLQCLHSLKSVLPPSCMVSVMGRTDRHSAAVQLAQSLEEEICALRHLVSSAANEVEKDLTLNYKAKVTQDCITDATERVQKSREDLKEEQTHIRLGAHLPASSLTYRENILDVAQIQMKSDALACKVAII